MNDLDFMRSRGTVMRSVRTGAALFGSGLVVGIAVTLIFGWLIRLAVVVAVAVIVLVAIARLAGGRRRRGY